MALPAWIADRAGTFSGTSNLYFYPPTLEGSCDSVARLAVRARGAAAELSYTWSRNGAPAEGVLTFHVEGDVVKASWTDSWHLSNDLMFCTGTVTEDGGISVTGAYAAPPGPDWGWRISLAPDGEHGVRLQMYNIEPGADETLAVDCQYGRTARANPGTLELGAFSVSLGVADLAASRAFWEHMGFEMIGGMPEANWVILRNGTTTLGLFQGMFEGSVLTFNPGWAADAAPLAEFTDVRDIRARLLEAGITLTTDTDPEGTGPGAIACTDPDGYAVLIDQHVPRG